MPLFRSVAFGGRPLWKETVFCVKKTNPSDEANLTLRNIIFKAVGFLKEEFSSPTTFVGCLVSESLQNNLLLGNNYALDVDPCVKKVKILCVVTV